MLDEERSNVPGIVLGLGLGGFHDGVQWHNMGSAVVPPLTLDAMQLNMRWDGFFHAATWVLVTAGVYLFLRDARRGLRLPTPRVLTGLLLIGWGAFNLMEGVVDHHLLEIHHVRDVPAHVPAYDWAFPAVGGMGVARRRRARPTTIMTTPRVFSLASGAETRRRPAAPSAALPTSTGRASLGGAAAFPSPDCV